MMGGEAWRVTWVRLQRRSLGTGLWEGLSAGGPQAAGWPGGGGQSPPSSRAQEAALREPRPSSPREEAESPS